MWSRCMFRVALFGAVGLVAAFPAATAVAQVRREATPKPEMPAVQPSGTIQAMNPPYIQIVTPAGESWVLQVLPNTRVQVTGMAKRDMLRMGSFISFVADVDKRRSEVPSPVEKLTLFTPSESRVLGAFPEGAAGAAGDVDKPDPTAEGAADDDAGAKTKAESQDGEGPALERFEIAGRIARIYPTGKLTVYAPNRYFRPTIQIELAEEPEIELDLSGPAAYQVIKVGDRLSGRGRLAGTNAAQVTDLTIALAEPLTMAQPEKPARRPPRSSRSHRGEKEQAEESPEAEEPKEKTPQES